ncbi:MAG: transglycosylase domain-containing protein, partial [Clostridiales bacterium]|nr:transglycosylase domain-containing protein [Clostridiales bacterium]
MDYSKDANHRRTNSKRRKRRKRKNSVGVILIRILLVIIIVGGFAVTGAMVGAYMGIIENTDKLSAIDVIPENYTSFIYDDLGNEIDSLHGEENREYVKLDQIPLDLQNAVIAIEDERFYTHSGIDFKGMLRALIVNLKSHDMSQGASTITQQLIKNEVLSSEKKLTRKLQEQYLAVQFENELEKKLGSKERAKKYILELYLNTIGLNHGLNGVQSAAKFYYGKDVSELDLAECASIAGITKNPSKYSPLSNPEKNKERQMTVLGKMLELGFITQSEYNEASQEDIYANIVGRKNEEETESIHNWFVDELVTEVATDLQEKKGYSRQQAYNLIYSGGLKIYSTENQQIQQIMEESYKNDALFPPSDSTLDVTYTISVLDTTTQEQKHYTRTTSVTSEEEVDAFIQSVQDELLDSTHTLVLDNKAVNRSLQSSMVVMDYKTGAVKGLVGGRGEKSGDLIFNRATQALRQPGSCFKVLASYAPAIDMGLVYPGTVIMDEPFDFNGW